jgi:hypothetical protein
VRVCGKACRRGRDGETHKVGMQKHMSWLGVKGQHNNVAGTLQDTRLEPNPRDVEQNGLSPGQQRGEHVCAIVVPCTSGIGVEGPANIDFQVKEAEVSAGDGGTDGDHLGGGVNGSGGNLHNGVQRGARRLSNSRGVDERGVLI